MAALHEDLCATERERFLDLFNHGDQAEGVRAFFEKRAPQWKND